jgi:hypothetical protein
VYYPVLRQLDGHRIYSETGGTHSKQRREVSGVITPRSLSSTCVTVPFWPTVCIQSVQSSQPSTWCERGRRRSLLLGGHPVRPFVLSPWWPHLSPWRMRRGPRSVFLTVRLSGSPLGWGGVPLSCPARLPWEGTGREPSPFLACRNQKIVIKLLLIGDYDK